jgi:hypothetical protein
VLKFRTVSWQSLQGIPQDYILVFHTVKPLKWFNYTVNFNANNTEINCRKALKILSHSMDFQCPKQRNSVYINGNITLMYYLKAAENPWNPLLRSTHKNEQKKGKKH